MARSLSFELDTIVTGDAAKRQPAWRIQVWDVRSGLATVGSIVASRESVNPSAGPFDISEFTSIVRVQERAGDYIQSGVAASIADITVQDPDGQFDPDDVLGDPDALGRFFRKGNVITIQYGDERLDTSLWVDLFFGIIGGQAGYARGRTPLVSELTLRAYGREASFMGFERTSDEFSNNPVVTYLEMAKTIATEEMGLSGAEQNLFGFGNQDLRHASVTLAKENPLSMLAKIMFTDGFLPKFNGSGVLEQTNGYATNSTDRFYTTDDGVLVIQRPLVETTPPDAVCVVGLDFELSRVDQPRQVVATMNVTTGYFTDGERLEVYWSDDRTQLVDNMAFKVLKSVNGGLNSLGGGEQVSFIASQSTNQVGTVGAIVTIDTGFAPWLSVFLLVTYIILAAIPDSVIATGGGFGVVVVAGFTISAGRITQAGALAAAMIILTKLGRGQYEFVGEPLEYVYSEIRECASSAGVSAFDRNEVEVLNHLVDNRTDAQEAAKQLLFRQQAIARTRTARMLFDPGLEPDDTFETLSDNRRFLVSSISYELKRDSGSNVAIVKCGEVTDGVAVTT
ncbi:MAG: hypothetical protein WBG86_06305 [Polyangiales bacterium]